MILAKFRCSAVVLCLSALSLTTVAPFAHADDDPGHSRKQDEWHHEVLDVEYDPAFSQDALITDDAEAQVVPPGPGDNPICSNETVQSGVNPSPSSPSFQLMYVVPSDVTPVSAMDVPQSCSNGSVKYSAGARASRNMATWLYGQNVGLNFRTATITYTHNYTGNQYSTRGMRRFYSSSTRSTWESLAVFDPATMTSPRVTKMRRDLVAAGFAVTSTKYIAVLHTKGQYHCDATGTRCGNYMGIAEQGGVYGFAARFAQSTTGALVTVRYGCATDGDSYLAHESTHLVGAPHVTDYAYDLMQASKPNANFATSPSLVWDYNRNSYDSTVRSSPYASLTNVSGTYFTC